MAFDRHQSWFQYSISRPYPFRWFTPVVLVGFLAFAALFSVVNYISGGFVLISVSTNSPNTTLLENKWFQHWPSLLTSKSQSTCQTLDLPVGSIISTNQTALRYTLTDVWQPPQNGTGNPVLLSSLPYLNNIIETCTISSIDMDLEALDRSANQIAYAEWGVIVRSFATCTILGANGTVMFNLTQEYDYVPSSLSMSRLSQFLGTNFISRDKERQASLWWGESLLSTYWAELSWQMQLIRTNDSNNGDPAIRRGTLSFSPNMTAMNDITDSGYFDVDYRFITSNVDPLGTFSVVFPGSYTPDSSNDPKAGNRLSLLSEISAYPNVWTIADKLAKSSYSTILTDLGQIDRFPNILNNASVLQAYSLDLPNAKYANAWPGPAREDYDTLKATTGPLGASSSTFEATYICQIPQRKSAGNLFVSVLIADLVFLQVVWRVFKLLVGLLWLRKRPDAQNCARCANPDQSMSATSGISKAKAPFRRLQSDHEGTELLLLRPTPK